MKKKRTQDVAFPREMQSFRMRIDIMEFVREQAKIENRSMTNYIEYIIELQRLKKPDGQG